VPLIRSSVASVAELGAARQRYEGQGYVAVEHDARRVLMTKNDLMVEIVLQGGSKPRSRRGVVVLIALLLVVSVAGYAVVVASGLAPGDCTVAATGTAFNVEISGIGADRACSNALNQSNLLVPSQPSGDVTCQYTQHFTRVTVRDQGVFKIAGNAYCSQLRQNFETLPVTSPSP
jgi:hypothetical protein